MSTLNAYSIIQIVYMEYFCILRTTFHKVFHQVFSLSPLQTATVPLDCLLIQVTHQWWVSNYLVRCGILKHNQLSQTFPLVRPPITTCVSCMYELWYGMYINFIYPHSLMQVNHSFLQELYRSCNCKISMNYKSTLQP